jgi:excisionase family DNA binding protein
MSVSPLPATVPANSAALLDVKSVAALLGGCSTRHIYRMSDSGRMPSPLRLGALVRWDRNALESWIAAGCPRVRHVAAKTAPVR